MTGFDKRNVICLLLFFIIPILLSKNFEAKILKLKKKIYMRLGLSK